MLTETGLWLQLSLSAFMSALFLRSFQVAQGFGVMVFDAPAAGLAPAEGEAIHQHSTPAVLGGLGFDLFPAQPRCGARIRQGQLLAIGALAP